MTINYKQTELKLSTETNLNVVNFVPLFSGHFEIWQHVSSPLWSQQPVHFKVITLGKNRKHLHTHIQLASYEDKTWGGNYSILNQCALETNWFDVDLVHRPLYVLKLSFSFFNWLHIQMRFCAEMLVRTRVGIPWPLRELRQLGFPLTTSCSSLSAGGRRVRARTCQSRAEQSRDPLFLLIYNNTSRQRHCCCDRKVRV